jgi:hypothetical protein
VPVHTQGRLGHGDQLQGVQGQHPTFTRAKQNVATAAPLLDTLPTPSTDVVDKVYQQLEDILSTAIVQQVKSSL